MILIISGTNRKGSYSLKVSKIVEEIYNNLNESCEILSLADVPFKETFDDPYSSTLPSRFKPFAQKVEKAKGLVIVCPEYNGSFPGILKYFIDHWPYPGSFTYKPVCFIGIGAGVFGGLRALEHLQGILLYRKGCICPEKVLIGNVQNVVKDSMIKDKDLMERLKLQAEKFIECYSSSCS